MNVRRIIIDQFSPRRATRTVQTQNTPINAIRILYCGDSAFPPFLNFMENIGILLTIRPQRTSVDRMTKIRLSGQRHIRLSGLIAM